MVFGFGFRGKMRDEFFQDFIKANGEATHRQKVPEASIQKYRGILPDILLKYWEEEGWNGYGDGLFWFVNPDDFTHIIADYLKDTPYEDLDTYHVFARTAFGELRAWGETYNRELTIVTPCHYVHALDTLDKKNKAPDNTMGVAISGMAPESSDLNGDNGPLFNSALRRLGRLKPDEVYGFQPPLFMGGRREVSHLAKLRMDVHLTILRQLGGPPATPMGKFQIRYS